MSLEEYVHTFGQAMLSSHKQRVHKIAIDASFTCPNRDGTKGRGGCTFCNNNSFSPNGREPLSVQEQINTGRHVIQKRTGAKCYLAYFQAYTNTYDKIEKLKALYDQALSSPDVIGLSIGTRPDCVPDAVLDLLVDYQAQGYIVWLELGLQSSFDKTLERVNRGHGFSEYCQATRAARRRGIAVCTHLIIGLPGETALHSRISLLRVLEQGVDGLKLHPLHVVKGTVLANQWRRGDYKAIEFDEYVETVADLVALTPADIIYHRLTGTASEKILLAPRWCAKKWRVLNAIENELKSRQHFQGINYDRQVSWSQ